MSIWRLVIVIAVGMIAVVNCQPSCSQGGADFSNVPSIQCTNVLQYVNGQFTSVFDFTFSWCQKNTAYQCPLPSFITQHGGVCSQQFTQWTAGMTYFNSSLEYTVNNGYGSSIQVSIECDPNGQPGQVTCPSRYDVVGNGPYWYSFALTSKSACGTPVPNCSASFKSIDPIACPNVPQLINGQMSGQTDLNISWCSRVSGMNCGSKQSTYVIIDQCTQFDQWTSGMTFGNNSLSYTVSNGASFAQITVVCDPNGIDGHVTCPTVMAVTGNGPYFYEIHVTSKNACQS
jgi:hypothetical protein